MAEYLVKVNQGRPQSYPKGPCGPWKILIDDTVDYTFDNEFPLISNRHVLRIHFSRVILKRINPRYLYRIDLPRNKVQEFLRIVFL